VEALAAGPAPPGWEGAREIGGKYVSSPLFLGDHAEAVSFMNMLATGIQKARNNGFSCPENAAGKPQQLQPFFLSKIALFHGKIKLV
jgi:hypothetical protein